MIEIFLIVLALIWIIFASISDLKKREVANWLNFSLIIFAMSFRFFYDLFTIEEINFMNFTFFIQGLIGLAIFFVLGNLFYYCRLFAGGDAKLLIALGSILPFYSTFYDNLFIFINFLILFLLSGMVYGIFWSLFLTIKNYKDFKKSYKRFFLKYKKIFFYFFVFGISLIFLSFFNLIFLFYGILFIIIIFLYSYAKAIDESCMIKEINTSNLTEGDWLYKEIKIGNKNLKPSWEGLNKKDINLIQKNYKNVKIREGIPYIPVFLISFLVLIFLFFKNSLFSFEFLF
jgi:Flp pilus assembly protein protease CpaA